ncbi:MAG: type IV secretion protein DotU [Desulfovibrio sp. S3730MH75]|nr:MAG: type IV secretion protein DotU [Desulfovibrio sp. S3730MH75]
MHLSDCFLELFTFIRLVTDSQGQVDADYDTVRKDISVLIERLEERALDNGFSSEEFDEARFAVFAWVDETVLCSSWVGTREWLKLPLQREFYGTANGGEEFFERLDVLLGAREKPVDETLFADFAKESEKESFGEDLNGNVEVLEVYTLCLSLGFTGVHFNDSDFSRLDQLREDGLARLVGKQDVDGLSAFPQSYGSGKEAKRKSNYGRVFDPLSILFFLLPMLVVAGVFFAYKGLLEYSLNLWLG